MSEERQLNWLNAPRTALGWISANSQKITDIVKLVGLILAPLIFYSEYRSKINTDMRQRALEEIKAFQASEELKIMRRHEAMLLDPALMKNVKLAAKASADGNLCVYHRAMAEVFSPSVWRTEVHQVIRRIETLAICVNSNLCEAKTVCDAVGRPIHDFLSNNCTAVKLINSMWGYDFAHASRQMLGKCEAHGIVAATYCDEILATNKSKRPPGMAGCLE